MFFSTSWVLGEMWNAIRWNKHFRLITGLKLISATNLRLAARDSTRSWEDSTTLLYTETRYYLCHGHSVAAILYGVTSPTIERVKP
jgi:hypothetical protein